MRGSIRVQAGCTAAIRASGGQSECSGGHGPLPDRSKFGNLNGWQDE